MRVKWGKQMLRNTMTVTMKMIEENQQKLNWYTILDGSVPVCDVIFIEVQ